MTVTSTPKEIRELLESIRAGFDNAKRSARSNPKAAASQYRTLARQAAELADIFADLSLASEC